MGKRYYWLKLQEDFFDSKRIKKLRMIAGGDTYTIIYLKIQLLAMKHDGIIEYAGVEDTFAKELALDIDEAPDNVEVTLRFLLQYNLAEMSEDGIKCFIPYAIANTGSEGSSAKRMRDMRAKIDKASHCDGEKEIEKDIDITLPKGNVCRTKDVRRIMEAWNSLRLSQIVKIAPESKRATMLRSRVKEYGVDGILQAIQKVAESDFLKGQNNRSWVITFDWFLKPNNFPKVLEGNFDNRAAQTPADSKPKVEYRTDFDTKWEGFDD